MAARRDRGGAVAMDVPPRPKVTEKPASLLRHQAAPERRSDRPHGGDGVAPVASRRGAGRGVPPEQPREARDGAGRALESGGKRLDRARRRSRAVLARQEAVPGHGEERKSHAAPGKIERDVHHRQAGAEHQHRLARTDDVERPADPGIADVAVRLVELGPDGRGVRGRVVAERQNDGVGGDARPGENDDRGLSVRPRLDVARHGDQPLETGRAGRAVLGLEKQRFEVLAVDPPRDVRVGPDRVVARARPAHEVIGVVGQRAHPPGRHVQDVGLDRRPVGHAAAHGAEPIDEHHPRRLPAAQKLRGHRRPAESAADDGESRDVAAHARGEDIREGPAFSRSVPDGAERREPTRARRA